MRGSVAAWLRFAVLSAATCACASSRPASDAGTGGDDAAVPADAAVDAGGGADAPTAQAPPPGAEVVSTGGQVRSGPVVMDVEIGHWVDQTQVTAGTRILEGAAVIKE